MQLVRLFDKAIHKRIGNMAKHRCNNAFDEAVGKHVFQFELNFAGIFAQGDKVPMPSQLLERAIDQGNIHAVRKLFVVACREVLLNPVIVNMYRRLRRHFCALGEFAATTPGQELWVVFHGIYQLKHGCTGMHD